MGKKWLSIFSFLSGISLNNTIIAVGQGDTIASALNMFLTCVSGFIAYKEYKDVKG